MKHYKGRITETHEEIYEELMQNPKVSSEWRTKYPQHWRWEMGMTMEKVEILRQDTSKLLKDLDHYGMYGPDEISPEVLKECAETRQTHSCSSQTFK